MYRLIKRVIPSGLVFFSSLCFSQPISDLPVLDYSKYPKQVERVREYDAIHYQIKLKFDEDKKTFWGETTMTLSPFYDGFSTCILDAETFSVTSVVDQDRKSLLFEQTDRQLFVHLSRQFNYVDTLSFTVFYHAELLETDQTNYRRPQGTIQGLDFAEETEKNPRLIQTFAFPDGAHHWFPCYDHPSDKATEEVFITVRENYKALSNGRLVSVTENRQNKTRTFHWSQELPHSTYLFVVAAGPYEVIQDSLGSLPINYWVYKKDVDNAMLSFYKTPDIISFFNQTFGYEYPWAKYDQITIPGFGGGAESTSATFLGHNTIHDKKGDLDFPSHKLVAHEAAHQWFGNLVTMFDWTHPWINESFGTYGEYLYSTHDLGEDEGAVNLLEKKNAYLHFAKTRYIRPIVLDRWLFPGDNWDIHFYAKGAAVLHMLRWIMGDKSFFRTLSYFLHKHAFQAVRTYDFKTAIKEATGQNLDWFLDQWLYHPGHPVFEVSYIWNEETKRVTITIDQIQDTSKGIPIYKTPVILGIVSDRENRSEKVWIEERTEFFEFDCFQKPLMIRFDRGNYLLKEWFFEKEKDELLYQLRNDDVTGRMWAATELRKHRDNSLVLTQLKETAREDSFWSVRRDAVYTLGSFEKEELIGFFKKIAKEEDSRVRVAALNALGNLKKKNQVFYFEQRFKKETSYLVQAEALRAIGKSGNSASVPFLVNALKMKSPRNVIQEASDWAIDKIHSQDVINRGK